MEYLLKILGCNSHRLTWTPKTEPVRWGGVVFQEGNVYAESFSYGFSCMHIYVCVCVCVPWQYMLFWLQLFMFRYIKTALLPSLPPINMACCTKPVEDLRKPTFGDNFPVAVPLNILYTKTLQVNVWCIDPSQREDCVVSFWIYYESYWENGISDHLTITRFIDIWLSDH